MEPLILLLLVALGIVSAIRGYLWLVQAMRDHRITLYEVLQFIEYELQIIVNFVWLYVIFSIWTSRAAVVTGLEALDAVLQAFPPGLLLAVAFFALTVALTVKGRTRLALLISLIGFAVLVQLGFVEVQGVADFVVNALFLVVVIEVIEFITLYRRPTTVRPVG